MCAAAASHTAWVNNLPPEALEAAIARHEQNGESMETIEDFGLAQADAAQRAMRQAMQLCQFGPGQGLVEILQATVGHHYDKSGVGLIRLDYSIRSVLCQRSSTPSLDDLWPARSVDQTP